MSEGLNRGDLEPIALIPLPTDEGDEHEARFSVQLWTATNEVVIEEETRSALLPEDDNESADDDWSGWADLHIPLAQLDAVIAALVAVRDRGKAARNGAVVHLDVDALVALTDARSCGIGEIKKAYVEVARCAETAVKAWREKAQVRDGA
jgi:hypothetical protein